MERNIYLYWTGYEYSLVRLLKIIIKCYSKVGKGYNLIFLTPENISQYIQIPEYFSKLRPAHQADYIRVNALCKYGGIWMDSDTLVMDNLDSLFDILEQKDGFFILENNTKITCGLFGTKKNTKFIESWRDKMNDVLNNCTNYDIKWNEIGNDILSEIQTNQPDLYQNYYLFKGLDTIYPVNWNLCVSEYLLKPYENYKNIEKEYQPLIILVNSVYKSLMSSTIYDILSMNKPLNYFLNKSIKSIENEFYNTINQEIFSYIYSNGVWNGNNKSVPLSGPGSSLDNTKDIVINLNNIIVNNNIKNVLDIGCGDLTWIPTCDFFKDETINYTGIDIVPSVINLNKERFPNKNFINESCLTFNYNLYDLIIIRDLIFHLKMEDIEELFKKIQNKFKYILITSCKNNVNTNNFDQWYFSKRNINIPPFNIPLKTILSIDENKFDRSMLLYKHDDFYNISQKKYILIVDWLKTYISLEPYLFCKKLEKYNWKIIELSKLDVNKLKSKKSIVLCVTYDSYDISLLKCDNLKLIYKIDDLYPYRDIRNTCINSSDIIISPYKYLFNKTDYNNILKKISFWISYSAVNEFYEDIVFNFKPKNKIFVSGYINDNYPLRNFVKTNKIFKNKIDSLDHPQYNMNSLKHDIINKEYFKKINEYICAFTCALNFKYVLLKVFEITSVGSLLLVEDTISEQLNELGYFDNENCIMCNKNNINEKMEWILNEENLDEVNLMRMKGMNLTREYHNTQKKSDIFNSFINTIL